ncbi:MAG: hypothetical protein ACXV0U_09230 [Kineosporiaceae bacterium]
MTAPTGRAQQGLRVLDEALRLIDLLQAHQSEARGEAKGEATGRAKGAVHADPDAPSSGRHLGGECRICPVCRGLALLREAHPEAVARMTAAMAELAAAVGEFVAGPQRPGPSTDDPAAAPRPDAPPTPPAMLRIDVTD